MGECAKSLVCPGESWGWQEEGEGWMTGQSVCTGSRNRWHHGGGGKMGRWGGSERGEERGLELEREGGEKEGGTDGLVSLFLCLHWSTMFPLTCFLAFPSPSFLCHFFRWIHMYKRCFIMGVLLATAKGEAVREKRGGRRTERGGVGRGEGVRGEEWICGESV